MKTKYNVGDHILIGAVVTEIVINKNIRYEIRTTEASNSYGTIAMRINEADIKTGPSEFLGCDECKYDHTGMRDWPCCDCEHNHISHFSPKIKEDEDVIDE